MGTRVNVDGLADAVIKGLAEYAELSTDGMKASVKKASKKCKEDISSGAPKRTGRYAKSWKTKVTGESSSALTVTVYSSVPGLPHLLEHGHAKRGGGRVSGRPHIAPAEESAEKMLEAEIKKALEG